MSRVSDKQIEATRKGKVTTTPRITPEPGTRAFTAMCMAEIMPQDGDPDFWDRWKDDDR